MSRDNEHEHVRHGHEGHPGHGEHEHHGGHGQEAKDVTIIVNGREKTAPKGEYTFDQIVALAFDPVPTGENIVFTITYRGGHGHKPEGILAEDDTVKLKNGMVFNVKATDKS